MWPGGGFFCPCSTFFKEAKKAPQLLPDSGGGPGKSQECQWPLCRSMGILSIESCIMDPSHSPVSCSSLTAAQAPPSAPLSKNRSLILPASLPSSLHPSSEHNHCSSAASQGTLPPKKSSPCRFAWEQVLLNTVGLPSIHRLALLTPHS